MLAVARAGHRDDRIKTGADDDPYVAGRGDAMVELGGGEDLADYSELKGRIVADLRKGFVKKGGSDRDEVSGVEDVTGARKADVLRGDGRQNEPAFVPTDEKIRLADMLAEAGLRRLEITSFVSLYSLP